MPTSSITGLALVFSAVTVLAALAVAWRFRRRPIVALIAARDRGLAEHVATIAALEATIAAERSDGRTGQVELLEAALRRRRRALAAAQAGAEFAGHRSRTVN